MEPKVSIVIPCYNYGKHIEKCIMSVLLQKLDWPIEIIVGDDNSSDDSSIIANRLKQTYESESIKFKVIKNDRNLGEINNTKSLLENSKGEYIAYLDADDFWTNPLKLARQVEFMEGNSEYSMCITGYIILEDEEIYIPSRDFSSWLCPINLDEMGPMSLSSGNTIGSSSSRVFRNYPGLIKDYFYEFPYSDWPMNFELSLRGKIKYLDFPGYVYSIHKNSLSKKDLDQSLDHHSLYHRRTGVLKSVLAKNNIID